MRNNLVDLITKDGEVTSARFTLWDESPEDEDYVRLELQIGNETITADADTFFDALAEIRKSLEDTGLRPKCFGSCVNVYPSPMIRSMGTGEMAYRLRLGHPARSADLVDIFSSTADIVPVPVEEQESFYLKWLESLR